MLTVEQSTINPNVYYVLSKVLGQMVATNYRIVLIDGSYSVSFGSGHIISSGHHSINLALSWLLENRY